MNLPCRFFNTSLEIRQFCKASSRNISIFPQNAKYFLVKDFLNFWISCKVVQCPQSGVSCLKREK